MANATKKKAVRLTVAQTLCHHFSGTSLVGCARAGLTCLEAHHQTVITTQGETACGVALDRCRQPHEPEVNRWDYVFTLRTGNEGLAVEVHPTTEDQIDEMIAKKEWAAALLARECPNLRVTHWLWVAPPPKGEILMLRHGRGAHRLAEAGIEFPLRSCPLP